jgi:LPS O-antigen subunit length determinant protein (WzzB/FepE family)
MDMKRLYWVLIIIFSTIIISFTSSYAVFRVVSNIKQKEYNRLSTELDSLKNQNNTLQNNLNNAIEEISNLKLQIVNQENIRNSKIELFIEDMKSYLEKYGDTNMELVHTVNGINDKTIKYNEDDFIRFKNELESLRTDTYEITILDSFGEAVVREYIDFINQIVNLIEEEINFFNKHPNGYGSKSEVEKLDNLKEQSDLLLKTLLNDLDTFVEKNKESISDEIYINYYRFRRNWNL